jgi:hypothetical protein
MKFDRDNLRETVIATVCELQEASGRALPEVVGEGTCPVGGLEGFDSLNTIEVTCELSIRLDCEISEKLFNPSKRGQQVSIGEMVDRLCNYLNEKGDDNSVTSK